MHRRTLHFILDALLKLSVGSRTEIRDLEIRWYEKYLCMAFFYSIVKDSSVDLGVNSKIVQIRPTVKAVSTKISKIFFAYLSIF